MEKPKLSPGELEHNLRMFTGTESYHRLTLNQRVVGTDGVAYLCEHARCYWLMDVIASTQLIKKVKAEPFKVWKLKVGEANEGKVVAEDGNGNQVYQQKIPYTDFPLNEIELYQVDDGSGLSVVMLKSEY